MIQMFLQFTNQMWNRFVKRVLTGFVDANNSVKNKVYEYQ